MHLCENFPGADAQGHKTHNVLFIHSHPARCSSWAGDTATGKIKAHLLEKAAPVFTSGCLRVSISPSELEVIQIESLANLLMCKVF